MLYGILDVSVPISNSVSITYKRIDKTEYLLRFTAQITKIICDWKNIITKGGNLCANGIFIKNLAEYERRKV